MAEYRVTWEIDVEADSPHEAAVKALTTQRNRHSIATVFEVAERHGQMLLPVQEIDLEVSLNEYLD